MNEIEYVPISIAKEDYQPELSTMNEPDAFRLKENNQFRGGLSQMLVDYLMEEFDRRLIKEIKESYNVATGSD
jgi:hypothetical protein